MNRALNAQALHHLAQFTCGDADFWRLGARSRCMRMAVVPPALEGQVRVQRVALIPLVPRGSVLVQRVVVIPLVPQGSVLVQRVGVIPLVPQGSVLVQRVGVISGWGLGAGVAGWAHPAESPLTLVCSPSSKRSTDGVLAIAGIAMKYVRHIAIAVTLLGHQKVAPAIEARVDGGIGWQVVISVRRWVVARFIGKRGIDRNCRGTTCWSALELKCALPHIAGIFVPGHAAPTT